MALPRTFWQKIQNSIWLTCGVVCLFFSLIFWAIRDKDDVQVELIKEYEPEVEIQIQPEKVAATTHLGALLEQVKPLELTTRLTASGTHEAEFRGTKYVTDNKNNHTIELFRAVEEDVVRGFIRKQTDRSNIVYIRLSGENQKEQFVVLYGNYRTNRNADSELKQLQLKLPNSVKPSVRAFEEYLPYVNDMGSEELGINAQIHQVTLVPAPIPRKVIPVPRPIEKQEEPAANEHSTTTTTVTRRDAEGNVVDVKRSQTEVPAQNNPQTDD